MGKHTPTALEKIETLTTQVKQLLEDMGRIKPYLNTLGNQINDAFKKEDQRLANLELVAEAVSSMLGTDLVAAKAKQIKIDSLEEQVKASEAFIDSELKNGTMEVSEIVTAPHDVVVVQETAPNGEVRHPSKNFFRAADLETEEGFKGSVGDTWPVKNGDGSVKVIAIYKRIPKQEVVEENSESQA